ncbi:sensor histidine kinase [Cohnella nanjingensis]|uniref:histidine kinase n=1 Tax=Cohnella nanjingensis TaxID=1387779 RepID=A0A7X0RRU0_9BACL|nr:HAMP domain-containing sensor histidine kinase [Cohnella nanjingensis]MBB6672482.1 HAMP domain-containing histidine kinase [Cohnella nanjingensis]
MIKGIRFQLIVSLLGVIVLPMLLLPVAGVNVESSRTGLDGERFSGVLYIIFTVSIAFICCAVALTRIITKRILLPLKDLTAAADHIVNGHLDFRIASGKQDEMGRFSAAFEIMRAKLQETMTQQAAYEQARKDLIASISHDLRTPLTSIKGYVEGLQDGIVHDKAKHERYLAVIRDKTEKLDELIEDLFQFSQLETGQLKMHYDTQDCRSLLEAIVQPLEREYRDHTVLLTVDRPFPCGLVRADRVRLTQVFDNLVGNAAKYAGKDAHIAILATISENRLEIEIGDDGAEIADHDLPHLFDRFYRGDKSRSSYLGGTGLGLAICKYIVEEHGGSIGVRVDPGQGNRFYCTLPLTE